MQVEGTLKVNTPPVLLGYKRQGRGGVPVPGIISRSDTLLTLFATIEPPLLPSQQMPERVCARVISRIININNALFPKLFYEPSGSWSQSLSPVFNDSPWIGLLFTPVSSQETLVLYLPGVNQCLSPVFVVLSELEFLTPPGLDTNQHWLTPRRHWYSIYRPF